MIKFYFVEGISRFDTLHFLSLTSQENFFESKLVSQMEDSYYPPHYKNEISVGSDDLDFNSKVNYLSIDFNDKTYYYFIDNINYVAEDLITLSVTMDTIQTYMFNITFKNIDVSRRLINRWVAKDSEYINRNYLRENLSEGVFYNRQYTDLTAYYLAQGYTGFIVAKFNKEDLFGNGVPTALAVEKIGERFHYTDDTFIYILPALNYVHNLYTGDNRNYAFYKNDEEVPGGGAFSRISKLIHNLAEEPEIVNMYYIAENPFTDDTLKLEYDETNDTLKLLLYGGDNTGLDFTTRNDNPNSYAILAYSGKLKTNEYIHNFNFIQNNAIDNLWNIKYIPQLLDENYIQAYYGERIKTTSFPMYQLNTTKLYCYNNIDILTGFRNYWLTRAKDNDDPYRTLITLDTNESVTLWNDAWKQYQATHLGTLGLGTIAQLGQSMFNVGNILSSRGAYTPKRKQISAKALRALTQEGSSITDDLVDSLTNNINLMFTPENVRQANNYTNDVISNNLHRIFYINEVTDLEEVGKQLEGYGYKVHEHYANQNIFTLLNTRYYFNIIQCDYIDIYIDILNSNEILDNIKQRFIDGIRLWNRSNIGNPYQYDNVEKEYL